MLNKPCWSFVKDVALVFLAASKLLSWISSVSEMIATPNAEVGLGWMILGRVLSLDLPNLITAILFVYFYRRNGNPFIKFPVLYIVALGFTFLYNWVLITLVFGVALSLEWFIATTIGFTINFIIITTFLLTKNYIKKKFAKKDTPLSLCESCQRSTI